MNEQTLDLNQQSKSLKFSVGAVFLLAYVAFNALEWMIYFLAQIIDVNVYQSSFGGLGRVIPILAILLGLIVVSVLTIMLMMRKRGAVLILPIGGIILINAASLIYSLILFITDIVFRNASYSLSAILTSVLEYADSLVGIILLLVLIVLVLISKKKEGKHIAKTLAAVLFFVVIALNFVTGVLDHGVSAMNSISQLIDSWTWFFNQGMWTFIASYVLDIVSISRYIYLVGIMLVGIWIINPYKKVKVK